MAHVFPLDLGTINRPMISFYCQPSSILGATTIIFPAPTNIGISDSAIYNEQNLNEVANAASGIGGRFAEDLKTKSLKDALTGVGSSKTVGAAVQALVTRKAKDVAGGNDTVKGAMIGGGMAFNPNTTTEFTGMQLRRFEFTFKLMPRSEAEAGVIKTIHREFQQRAYPKADNIGGAVRVLKYPPKWKINFIWKNETALSFPKIYHCYLDRLSLTVNPTASMWHHDGSPGESDLSVSFVETKALTLNEIQAMDPGAGTPGGEQARTVTPLVTTPEQPAANAQGRQGPLGPGSTTRSR